MINLITTVGTSLFRNYGIASNDENYKCMGDKPYECYQEYLNESKQVERAIISFYDNKDSTDDISAEIKTTKKVKESLNADIDVYLLASDTIISCLAANIIKYFLEKDDIRVHFNPELYVIKGLQVQNRKKFINEGLSNLITRVNTILKENNPGNVAFNISGGYKVTIPYFTLMAQINRCSTYYTFENTEELIEIPAAPISINDEMFNKYRKEFEELSSYINDYDRWKNNHHEFTNIAKSCIETYGNIASLSPIGEILWGNYKNKYVSFFATDEVVGKIKENKELANKLLKILGNEEIRKRKTEKKGKHLVYDDGNNGFRIIYIDHDDKIYVYAAFDHEPDELKFLDDPKQSNKIEDYDFEYYAINKQALTSGKSDWLEKPPLLPPFRRRT